MTAVIKTEGMTKAYGSTTALDGFTFEVETGEIHGFLGPNGAGKTTTIRVLLGMIQLSSGRARVFDLDPWTQAVRVHARTAYVPGDVTLWPTLTGGEVIDFLGRLQGHADVARRDQLLERFDLDPTKKCRAYSKGNRQKVALIAALAADVELLILDGPTSGLDPLMEEVFRQTVREHRERGGTTLLSSHILSEAESLCDRISIIRSGRLVETAPLSQLRAARQSVIVAELRSSPTLTNLSGLHDVAIDDLTLRCRVDAEALDALLARLTQAGVNSLTCAPPSIEDVFLEHYRSDAPQPPTASTHEPSDHMT